MDVLSLFERLESTGLGLVVRESVWLFPVIEALHLLGLSLLGGAALLVDLRMVGLGLTHTPTDVLARHARPWLVWSVVVMVVTGLLLFLSEAVKCYYSTAFRVKILTFPVAVAFTFLVRQRVAESPTSSPRMSAMVGGTSFALWFLVAAAGRWIGFS